MRIVFGWNHFKIKSFQPHELGMNASEQFDFTVEARQKYFHLFWIPFFAIGKTWAIRKNGGRLYEVPLEMQPSLYALESDLKTPWYAFAGPLLILLGCIGFWGYTEFENYEYQTQARENQEKRTTDLTQRLQKLDTTDMITVVSSDAGKVQYLKLEKSTATHFTFTAIPKRTNQYEESMMEVEDDYLVGKKFLPLVSIHKDSLRAAIPTTEEGNYLISKFGKDLLGDGNKMVVQEIVRHFRPILRDAGTGSFTNYSINMTFKNFGWPFEILSIKNLVGAIKWDPTLVGTLVERPESHFGKSFDLNGTNFSQDTPYKFELAVKDTIGRIFRFQIEGTNFKKTITELN